MKIIVIIKNITTPIIIVKVKTLMKSITITIRTWLSIITNEIGIVILGFIPTIFYLDIYCYLYCNYNSYSYYLYYKEILLL